MGDTQKDVQNSPSPELDALMAENTRQDISSQQPPGRSSCTFFPSPSAIPHQTATPPFYGHRSGYNTQTFNSHTQPPPVLGHDAPFATYPSAFTDPRVSEGSVTSQNPHIHYHPIVQHHVPIYYQPHPSPAPIRSHFQHMHYPSPLSPSQFSYANQGFPASPPVYSPYPSHQPYMRPEAEPRGAWYYLPHHVQQHPGSSITYQGHYPNPYPSVTPSDVEAENPGSQDSGAHPRPTLQEPTRTPDAGGHPHPASPGQSLGPPPSSLPPAERVDALASGIEVTPAARRQEKPMVRKAYHPNPPPQRSEWVMWVGNIPSDATQDELLRFFNQPQASAPADIVKSTWQSPMNQQPESGVLSIFLISKSSCVFVNYQTEGHLIHAIERFNGRPLRPHDPRCLRLVCRVRKRDDDLKAGVGGQRGQGLHVRWIRDQKLKEKQAQSDVSASDEYSRSQASGSSAQDSLGQLTLHTSDLNLSSDEEGKRSVQTGHRSSSGSFASTDSGFLSNFFPKRYFILKSLTQVCFSSLRFSVEIERGCCQYDLDLSVQQGLWATQKHNEGILDQAYRTSKDVFLIFGVNKSGEFYGYARYANGPLCSLNFDTWC